MRKLRRRQIERSRGRIGQQMHEVKEIEENSKPSSRPKIAGELYTT